MGRAANYYNMDVLALDQLKALVAGAVPGAQLTVVPNDTSANQPSLLVDSAHAVVVASFLRDDSGLRLDYCSNVTGVDWPEAELTGKIRSGKSWTAWRRRSKK